jgi:hypothetical protein
MQNLAADPAHAATMTQLFHELKKWQNTVSDRLMLDPADFSIQI